ncbi:MAG: hypothetical protein MI741_02675, partial [Rhodospirillales bacterium]|nr:hypothetical protein [Rhodospirillales bacterium]
DGFAQLTREYQEHEGVKDSNTLAVEYHFDATLASNKYTKGYRFKAVTYPNGRHVHATYGTSGQTDDVLSRVVQLTEDDGTGTSGALGAPDASNVIVAYTHLGTGRLVRKDYPTPDIRMDMLDETSGEGTEDDPLELSVDEFGRSIRYQWESYDGSGNGDGDLFNTDFAYDRASNLTREVRNVYGSYSKVYTHDNLHRLTGTTVGIYDGSGGIEDYWDMNKRIDTLDALGNQTSTQTVEDTALIKRDTDDANQITSNQTKGRWKRYLHNDYFDNSATASDYTMVGTETVTVDSGGSDVLTFSTPTQDTIDSNQEPEAQAIALIGEDIGPATTTVVFTFPTGATSGQAGIVFGYKSSTDYWLRVIDLGAQKIRVYHVHMVSSTLTKELMAEESVSVSAGSAAAGAFASRRFSCDLHPNTYNFDYPSGRIGLYVTALGGTSNPVEFDYILTRTDDRTVDFLGRWDNFNAYSVHDETGSDDHLRMVQNINTGYKPTLLKGTRAKAFRMTAKLNRWSGDKAGAAFVFNATDQDDFDAVIIYHWLTSITPSGYEVV